MPLRLPEVGDPAIEHDLEAGMRGLEPIDAVVVERRHVAVLARRKSVEPGLARMHDERVDTGLLDGVSKRFERMLGILVIDGDTALDGDRHSRRVLHGGNAFADQHRLGHQAGAETALLHALGGTPDIEVDLGEPEIGGDARAKGELVRLAAAQLKRDRMLARIMGQQPRPVAVQHRAGGDHLGIDQRARCEQAMEEPAMPVGPIHHRGD